MNFVYPVSFTKPEIPQPGIRLERNGFSNLRNGLLSSHYDLIITLLFEVDSIRGAQHAELLSQHGVIAISRHNPKASLSRLSLEMLADENFVSISPEESPAGYTLLIEECNRAGFTPRIVRCLSSLESLLLCVEAGIGVATLDPNTRLDRSKEVRTIPIPDSSPAHVCAVWLKTNSNPIIRDLVYSLQGNRAAR